MKTTINISLILGFLSVSNYVHAETRPLLSTGRSTSQKISMDVQKKTAEEDYSIDVVSSEFKGNGIVNIYLKKGIDLNKYFSSPLFYGSYSYPDEEILGQPIIEDNQIIGFKINLNELINVKKKDINNIHFAYVNKAEGTIKRQPVDSDIIQSIVDQKAYVNPDSLKYDASSKTFTLDTTGTLVEANRLMQLTTNPDNNYQIFATQASDSSGTTSFTIPDYLSRDRSTQFTVTGNTYGEIYRLLPYNTTHSAIGTNILYNSDFSEGLTGWDSATLNGFNTLQTNTITGNVLNMKMTSQNAQSPFNRMTLLQFVDTFPNSRYKYSIDIKANKLVSGVNNGRLQFKQIFAIRGSDGFGEGGIIYIAPGNLGEWIHVEGIAYGATLQEMCTPGIDVTDIEDVDIKNPQVIRLD